MEQKLLASLIEKRRQVISDWLEDHAPYTCADQHHLNAGTPEQAYWHHGYLSALDDIICNLTDHDAAQGNADTSNPFPPPELGE